MPEPIAEITVVWGSTNYINSSVVIIRSGGLVMPLNVGEYSSSIQSSASYAEQCQTLSASYAAAGSGSEWFINKPFIMTPIKIYQGDVVMARSYGAALLTWRSPSYGSQWTGANLELDGGASWQYWQPTTESYPTCGATEVRGTSLDNPIYIPVGTNY